MYMCTLDLCLELNVQLKPIGSSIDGGAQVQQIINVECRTVFFDAPLLDIKFQYVCPSVSVCLSVCLSVHPHVSAHLYLSLPPLSYSGAPHHLVLKLPVMAYKFIEPVIMNSQEFFQRWKQLSG